MKDKIEAHGKVIAIAREYDHLRLELNGKFTIEMLDEAILLLSDLRNEFVEDLKWQIKEKEKLQ